MSNYIIEADHEQLIARAKEIEAFVDKQKSAMKNMDAQVNGMQKAAWSGKDARAFYSSWQSECGAGSDADRMMEGLKSFASALRRAAGEYQKAQLEAINRVNRIF